MRGARQHITDSTAMLTVFTPSGAFMEHVLAGMTDEVSLRSRLMVGGLFYGGYGGLVGHGLYVSRRQYNITGTSPERDKNIHDMKYFVAVTLATQPWIYLVAGARDVKEVVVGTFFAAGMGLAGGGVVGYVTDLFRDLTGYEPSQRIPQAIQDAPPLLKKALAAGIIVTSLGLTSLTYRLVPDSPKALHAPSPKVQIIEKHKDTNILIHHK